MTTIERTAIVETYIAANFPGSTTLVTDYHIVIAVSNTSVEVRANWQRRGGWEVVVSGSSFTVEASAMLDELALFMDAARIGAWLKDKLAGDVLL